MLHTALCMTAGQCDDLGRSCAEKAEEWSWFKLMPCMLLTRHSISAHKCESRKIRKMLAIISAS
eukprot:5460782-Amphidinium_carterae.1